MYRDIYRNMPTRHKMAYWWHADRGKINTLTIGPGLLASALIGYLVGS